jgi:S-adenosylmethionine:tRNA ribosyltransferase-isomerase
LDVIFPSFLTDIISPVLVSDFHYRLPEELIAQEALADRAGSRLLHVARETGALRDLLFRDFPGQLRSEDLLVLNNTRVFPARLYGRREGVHAQPVSSRNPAARDFLQGRVEALLTRQVSEEPNVWDCLVRPGRKIAVGEHLCFGDKQELQAEVIARGKSGQRQIRFEPAENFFALVERLGHVPLPPYIARPDRIDDRQRYQTVYARQRGSVAAPTAGLHFTPEILATIATRGIEIAEVTLHVGLGTFQPIRADRVEDHEMHRESYNIPEAAAGQINGALNQGRRIVAVGTTTVRTLESSARETGRVRPGASESSLFIYPGFDFRVVGAMLTNFHLPQSTLLMLVSAFAGRERVLAAYEHAVEARYRFFSYGDCMFVA